jgi:hypothetical protein
MLSREIIRARVRLNRPKCLAKQPGRFGKLAGPLIKDNFFSFLVRHGGNENQVPKNLAHLLSEGRVVATT